VFMLCCDDSIRVWDGNVCADKSCARILAEFQLLIMNKSVGEAGMFSNICHDFETVSRLSVAGKLALLGNTGKIPKLV